MNRFLPLVLGAVLCLVMAGVHGQGVLQSENSGLDRPFDKVYFTGSEDFTIEKKASRLRHPGIGIGITYYDLQTNGSVQRRLDQYQGGDLVGAWTMSRSEFDAGFADRGTGFNRTTGMNWGPYPTARLEDRRTGWPSVNYAPNGDVVVVSHTSDGRYPNPPLNILTESNGAWDQNIIPTNTGQGILWPRAAVSEDGTIHVIAITTPVANGGVAYNGLDGHLLYWRSKDGGSTWDVIDGILPGSDATNYVSYSGDSYSIVTKGNTVAIAHFDSWNDVAVYKSDDNGDTWERMVVNDFPLDNYTRDTYYSIDDIGGIDTLGPGGSEKQDSAQMKAIYTSDNAGSVVIDGNGKVHVFYGEMYVTDDAYGDGTSSYYPGWNGLAYWNEDMTPGERPVTITGALDEDGNDVLDLQDEIALYFYSLSSMPFAYVDDNDDIYLCYSAVSELNYSLASLQNFRHIYLMKSTDGGETWSDPVDQINKDLFEDDDELYQFVEAVFPSITVDDNYVHLIYQQDYEPGLHVRGDEDEVMEQEIIYLKVDKETLSKVENVVRPEALGMDLSPNPVSSTSTKLNFSIESESKVTYEVLNMSGKVVVQKSLGTMSSGVYSQEIYTGALSGGMYIVRLIVNDTSAALRLNVK